MHPFVYQSVFNPYLYIYQGLCMAMLHGRLDGDAGYAPSSPLPGPGKAGSEEWKAGREGRGGESRNVQGDGLVLCFFRSFWTKDFTTEFFEDPFWWLELLLHRGCGAKAAIEKAAPKVKEFRYLDLKWLCCILLLRFAAAFSKTSSFALHKCFDIELAP